METIRGNKKTYYNGNHIYLKGLWKDPKMNLKESTEANCGYVVSLNLDLNYSPLTVGNKHENVKNTEDFQSLLYPVRRVNIYN